MSLDLLAVTSIPEHHEDWCREAGWTVHLAREKSRRDEVIAAHGHAIRAVLTNGNRGFSAAEMDALPALEMICAQGVGYENIDRQAAAARGIVVTHGPGANSETVADHALGLMLASIRRIPQGDAGMRNGEWRSLRQPAGILHGKTLGILGMGNIGCAIARRAADGFGMRVIYHSRTAKPELPYQHETDTCALAQAADVLVSTLPGGDVTHHMIDATLLNALGEQGTLVNIGRGTVLDTNALIDAIKSGRIAGAALDVFETEPDIPDALLEQPNIVLTPHTAGLSTEALDATMERVIDNLGALARGAAPVTPVPTDD